MKYEVCVRDSSTGYVSVEADSVEDAKEKAETEYENGNVYWKNSDLDIVSVRAEQERTDAHESR